MPLGQWGLLNGPKPEMGYNLIIVDNFIITFVLEVIIQIFMVYKYSFVIQVILQMVI